MMIIISYRASTNRNTACHCHPEFEYGESSLAIKHCETLDDAVDFISQRLWEGEDHQFVHLVFQPIEDLRLHFDGRVEETPYAGTASIEVVSPDPGAVLRTELAARVGEKLQAYQAERDEKKRQRDHAAAASAKAAQRAADLMLLKKLQARLEEEEI